MSRLSLYHGDATGRLARLLGALTVPSVGPIAHVIGLGTDLSLSPTLFHASLHRTRAVAPANAWSPW